MFIKSYASQKEIKSYFGIHQSNTSIFSVAMILMPIIAFAVMHVGAFLNKVFAETSFQMAIAQKGVQYIRSKNVFLLQELVKTHNRNLLVI